MKEKAFFKKFKNTGPGGMHCACCFPAPGELRKKEFRISKRKESKFFNQSVQDTLGESDEQNSQNQDCHS